jgi:HD-GYP domain-containing protein (c-di-GMP phosphodiesterase class II)
MSLQRTQVEAERIATIGRIVAVASAYDAMTTDRANRKLEAAAGRGIPQ